MHFWDERPTTTEEHRHLHAAGRPGSEHRSFVDEVTAVQFAVHIPESFLEARRPDGKSDETAAF